jgi:deazaflavin-dependent oxidoreductase (nitroreductase family)
MNPELEHFLIRFFRQMNRGILLLWRLGLGGALNGWPKVGGRIMVLTHTGRKSGQLRRTPLNYTILEGDVYCVAGFGKTADWYRNLLKTPDVEVWLPGEWWAGRAEDVSDLPERLRVLRQVLVASGFASFAAGINPYRLSDEALAEATAEYRLVRIRRIQPCTGPGGPGELAWVWPAAVLVLLALRRLESRRGR